MLAALSLVANLQKDVKHFVTSSFDTARTMHDSKDVFVSFGVLAHTHIRVHTRLSVSTPPLIYRTQYSACLRNATFYVLECADGM